MVLIFLGFRAVWGKDFKGVSVVIRDSLWGELTVLQGFSLGDLEVSLSLAGVGRLWKALEASAVPPGFHRLFQKP